MNVLLYTLTLTNALVQNCNLNLKQEIASRQFLSVLTKLVNSAKTHVTVKSRILDLIYTWSESFKSIQSLDYMTDIYNKLVSEGIYLNILDV